MYKILIGLGIILILAGIIIAVLQKFNVPLGRLPGDISVQKENFSFYFPITTCILLSIVISFVIYIFRR